MNISSHRIFIITCGLSALLLLGGCAKESSIDTSKMAKEYFDAWMSVNHPGLTPTGLGVYIIDDQVPNAFATGRNPEHAAVAVTTALMNYLTPKEIEGVLGHEMTHVKNRDILISTVAASFAGIITTISRFALWFGGGNRDRNNSNPIAALFFLILAPIAAAVIQMAVSRSREYLADEGGGALCGNPNHLADALEKISQYSTRRTMQNATEATAHMFIMCPFSAKDMQKLFSTHPSTEERVALLRKQAEEMRRQGKLED